MQKKTYHKFKSGPVFYIISDIDSKSIRYKPGFEGVDINMRLQQHRTSLPGCKLEFLIYSDNAKLIETLVLTCFDEKRIIKNKEWLFDIDIQTLIRQTVSILNVTNIKYTQEENIKDYNNDIIEDFKLESNNLVKNITENDNCENEDEGEDECEDEGEDDVRKN